MKNINQSQKKKTIMNYAYATLIGLLVVAFAITIALVSTNKPKTNLSIGGDIVPVASKPTYTTPMKNSTVAKDYSGSELQYNDTLKQWEIHKAIDFLASDDLNVYAMSSGTVSNIYTNYLDGTVVEISHSNGLVSVYKSLNDVSVKVGDSVITGQTIGTVGTNMASEANTGAHLHFEVIKDGKKVDPNNYIDLGNK